MITPREEVAEILEHFTSAMFVPALLDKIEASYRVPEMLRALKFCRSAFITYIGREPVAAEMRLIEEMLKTFNEGG